jgi:hypothetical protein
MSAHAPKTAAATLVALALAAPTAAARPILDPPTQRDLVPPERVIVRSADEGFEWGSAGIGAAATLIAAAAVAAVHRSRKPVATPMAR